MLAKQLRHWWAGAQIAFEARPSAAGAVGQGHKWVWSECHWPGCSKWEPKNFALSLLSLWRWAPVVEHVYFWSSRGSGIYVVSGKVGVVEQKAQMELHFSGSVFRTDPKHASYLSSL
eukprot:g615.t1